MSATTDLQAFAQSIYLVIKNRYFDDLASADGQTYLAQVVDWTNQFLDEIENEVDPSGNPIDWTWVRQNGVTLGTVTTGDSSIDFDTDSYNNLLTDQGRYVQITVGGQVVSNWAVVTPADMTNKPNGSTPDTCALIGDTIVFSRVFNSNESGGTITGDVSEPLPRMSLTNVEILTTVKPKQLLILGVAKNATLPDIVQGGLSPSYTQKYTDLLNNAIARNMASTMDARAERDGFSYIGGVGF